MPSVSLCAVVAVEFWMHPRSPSHDTLTRQLRGVLYSEQLARLDRLAREASSCAFRASKCSANRTFVVVAAMYLSFGPIGQNFTVSATKACARRPGAAASVSRWRRERHTLLAGGGRRASRSHTLAASQAFECMHTLFSHRVKT